MAGHAQLKFVMTECSKTQIRLMALSGGVSIHVNSFVRSVSLNGSQQTAQSQIMAYSVCIKYGTVCKN